MISTVVSVIMTVLILLFDTQLLKLLFGKIEPDIMKVCESYLIITTLSLPALAVYDAGAALCRSIGKANVTMYISIIANVINVVGNCIGVFGLKLGAVGVAYPSLISRILSAVAVTIFFVLSIVWNTLIFAITPLLVRYCFRCCLACGWDGVFSALQSV